MMGVVCLPGKQKEELCVVRVLETDWPFRKLAREYVSG